MNPVWGVAILVLSVWFLLAVLSSAIALRKNRSVTKWYILTLLFGDRPLSRHPLPAAPPSGSLFCLSNVCDPRSAPVPIRDSSPKARRLTLCTTVACVAA